MAGCWFLGLLDSIFLFFKSPSVSGRVGVAALVSVPATALLHPELARSHVVGSAVAAVASAAAAVPVVPISAAVVVVPVVVPAVVGATVVAIVVVPRRKDSRSFFPFLFLNLKTISERIQFAVNNILKNSRAIKDIHGLRY